MHFAELQDWHYTMVMAHSQAMRDALRLFRLFLVVKLIFLGLSFVAILSLGGQARVGLLLRAAPALVLALFILPRWLERPLGGSFLAIGLVVDLFLDSIEAAPIFFERGALLSTFLHLPEQTGRLLAESRPMEPFFFLLIPLVLAAWGYGRRGALLASTWAAILHLGTGFWALERDLLSSDFIPGVVARVLLLYLVPLIVSVLAVRQRRQFAELESAHQRLRRHAATMEQLAVSRERNRLARDLHDTLAHSLAALSVQLEAVRTLLIHDPVAAQAAVDEAAAQARRGLDESRQAIQALRADRFEALGLTGALRDLVQAFQARTGVPSELSVAGQEPDLTAEETQALYGIAEEALHNVECHAAAKHAGVRLDLGADRIDLIVRDNGAGFDPGGVDPERYGLAGMRERAALIGAALSVSSRPGGGTEIRCTLNRG